MFYTASTLFLESTWWLYACRGKNQTNNTKNKTKKTWHFYEWIHWSSQSRHRHYETVTRSGYVLTVIKCNASMTTHHSLKQKKQHISSIKCTNNSCGQKNRQQKEKHPTSYGQSDPKQRQLTGSLVFDEEQLEALLESVLIHIELYLHPMRWMERWAETERERERERERGR